MHLPVVIDFETKYTFREFSDPKKLEISVAGAYNYATDELKAFTEDQLPDLFKWLENASCVIGFNIIDFDLPVLQAYYPGDVTSFPVFDIMADIKTILGRRLSLDSLVKATLNTQKSGHGLLAVEYFKQGKMEELSAYCKDDVSLTRQLFEYGIEQKEIWYLSPQGKSKIAVSWAKHMKKQDHLEDRSLTLPF
jgi:3'-5' exonuclease